MVVEMHETFKKIGHLPVNVHFTMNRYPIRNHQCVISKAGFTKTMKSHPIPESILFPTEDNFDPTIPDCRRFRWKENVKFLLQYFLTPEYDVPGEISLSDIFVTLTHNNFNKKNNFNKNLDSLNSMKHWKIFAI